MNVPRPPCALSAFHDVLAVGRAVVTLHDALAPVWRGTRSNAQAALKVHARVRALTGEVVKYRVTAESHADCRAFRIDAGLRGCLVLFDKAYSSPSLWQRIESVGGYVLTRLPTDRSPEIESVNRKHGGRSRKAIGPSLREVLHGCNPERGDRASAGVRVAAGAGTLSGDVRGASEPDGEPRPVVEVVEPKTAPSRRVGPGARDRAVRRRAGVDAR